MENIETLSYEQALMELAKINSRLKDESLPLEEAVKLFEDGRQLVEYCTKKIDEAKARFRVVDVAESTPEAPVLNDEILQE